MQVRDMDKKWETRLSKGELERLSKDKKSSKFFHLMIGKPDYLNNRSFGDIAIFLMGIQLI